jgi:AraC-like DNA-binding protein
MPRLMRVSASAARRDDAPVEVVRFKHGRLPGVLQLSVEHTLRPWSAFHESFAFASVPLDTRSLGTWTYRKWTASTKPAGVMLMEPNTVHRTTKIEGSPASFKVLFVDPARVHSALDAVDFKGPRHFREPDCTHPAVSVALSALHRALESDDGEPAPALDERLNGCITALFEASAEPGPALVPAGRESLVARARARLHAMAGSNDPDPVDIAAIASELESSYHWLIHLFTRELGVSPYQYYLHMRLERVRRQLLAGPTPAVRNLTALAHAHGFADLAHLDRQFSRSFGVPPTVFLAQVGGLQRWKQRLT